MKNLYLLLAILGAVVPYIFFFDHFSTSGYSLAAFVGGLFANGAAGGFSADVVISSAVFWIWMWQRKAPLIGIFILLNLGIGLSCAFPAYLYVSQTGAKE